MIPKEKAKKLVEKMAGYQWRQVTFHRSCPEFVNACNCAIIMVDEILSLKLWGKTDGKKNREYWQGVKAEIEKL